MANSPEIRLMAHTLAAMSRTDLLLMASRMCPDGYKPGDDKVKLVIAIMRSAGYSYAEVEEANKAVRAAPTILSADNIYHLMLTYVEDEVMLLEATASALRSISLLAKNRGPGTQSTQALSRDSVAEVQRLMAHSNLTRMIGLLRLLLPRHGELSR